MAVAAAWVAANAATTAAVASTTIAVASTVQSTMQAQKNAQAQAEAAKIQNEAAIATMGENYAELSEIERDAYQKSLDESMSTQQQYLQERGRVNVMAAFTGTTGQSITGQLQDLERERFSNYNTIMLNRQVEYDNVADQATSLRQQTKSGLQSTEVVRPSYAAAALNIGGALASGYSQFSTARSTDKLAATASSIKSTG